MLKKAMVEQRQPEGEKGEKGGGAGPTEAAAQSVL